MDHLIGEYKLFSMALHIRHACVNEPDILSYIIVVYNKKKKEEKQQFYVAFLK